MRERDAFEPPGFHEADGSLVRERAPTWRMRKVQRRWSMTQTVNPVHRPTWLCPDAASRERLLDMDERLKRPRALAFALIAVGIGAAVPLIGWWGLGLLLVAVLGFRLAQGIAERIRAPEYALFASWAVSELVIAGSVAVTGGITSYTASWLLVPLVTLPARFGSRGVGAGVAFIGVLVIVITIAIEPSQPLPPIYALFALLTTLTAVSILSTALMRSDVDHRTEAVIDGLTACSTAARSISACRS